MDESPLIYSQSGDALILGLKMEEEVVKGLIDSGASRDFVDEELARKFENEQHQEKYSHL